jgi:asparagine synthetase B (glutamine-hydrolysing)
MDFIKKLDRRSMLVLLDYRNKILILKADAVGHRILYYHSDKDAIYFSTSLRLLTNDITPALDKTALNCYLNLGYIPKEITIFQNIRKLMPSHSLLYKNGKINIFKYCDIYKRPLSSPSSFYRKNLESRFKEVFTRFADKKIGIMVSGGLDSSFLLRMASLYSKRKITTFTFGSEAYLKGALAESRKISALFNTQHYELAPSLNDYLKYFTQAYKIIDEPVFDLDLPLIYYFLNFTKRLIDTLYHGFGSDEVFGGAPQDFISQYRKFLRICGSVNLNHKNGILTLATYSSMLHRVPQALNAHYKISNFFNTNLVFPYLDYDIVNLGFKMPEKLKIKNGTDKFFFRQMAQYSLPKEFVFRKKLSAGIPAAWRKATVEVFRKDLNNFIDIKKITSGGKPSLSLLLKLILLMAWQEVIPKNEKGLNNHN